MPKKLYGIAKRTMTSPSYGKARLPPRNSKNRSQSLEQIRIFIALARADDVRQLQGWIEARLQVLEGRNPEAEDNGPAGPAFIEAYYLELPEIYRPAARLAGPFLSPRDVAARLGISRQAVNKGREEGRLLGVRCSSRFYYPEVQFLTSEVIPGLPILLRAMGTLDAWEKLRFLIDPARYPSADQTPIKRLKNGERGAALMTLGAALRAAENAGEVSRPSLDATAVETLQALEADIAADLMPASALRARGSRPDAEIVPLQSRDELDATVLLRVLGDEHELVGLATFLPPWRAKSIDHE